MNTLNKTYERFLSQLPCTPPDFQLDPQNSPRNAFAVIQLKVDAIRRKVDQRRLFSNIWLVEEHSIQNKKYGYRGARSTGHCFVLRGSQAPIHSVNGTNTIVTRQCMRYRQTEIEPPDVQIKLVSAFRMLHYDPTSQCTSSEEYMSLRPHQPRSNPQPSQPPCQKSISEAINGKKERTNKQKRGKTSSLSSTRLHCLKKQIAFQA